LSEDLIGLSIGVEEDYGVLTKSFESEIAPRLSTMVARETRDITAPVSQSAINVIQTLYIMSAGGHGCTKEAVRQYNKRLFMRGSMIPDKFVKEVVQSGFANEETNQIEPSVPKAHVFLLNLLEQGPQEYQMLQKRLGAASDAITKSAMDLGLIYPEDDKVVKRRIAEFEDKATKSVESLQKAYEDPTVKQSEAGQWIKWLLDAYDRTAKTDQVYFRCVLLWAIQERAPLIEEEIRKSLLVPSAAETAKKVPESVPEITEAPSTETKPAEAEPARQFETVPVPSKPTGLIENAILQIVQASGPLTVVQIDSLMKKQGYEVDVKGTVVKLVLMSKLKIVASG
jgi:hypothetical protein